MRMKVVFIVLICLLSLSVIYGYNALLANHFEEGAERVVYHGNNISIDSERNARPLGDPIRNPHPH